MKSAFEMIHVSEAFDVLSGKIILKHGLWNCNCTWCLIEKYIQKRCCFFCIGKETKLL